jgi:DNA-binding transcriptional regulator YhcF (GntR family)
MTRITKVTKVQINYITTMNEYLYSVREVAQFLRVSVNTAQKYLHTWAAPAVRRMTTRKFMVKVSDLDRIMIERNGNKYIKK